MAINKQKVLETAQRFVEKGQTDKAIKEFLKIVEEDPRDVRIWLKIGDLYARKGAKAEATQTYLRVAEFYGEQGFYLKAVAVYKQILKLDPRLVEVNLKLADVYRKLGLLSDAIQQYEVVAAFYHREGRSKDALATIRELVELDPENVATRIKLAELYSKEGMTGSAVVEFGRAADHLRSQGRTEDFMKVAERLVWHQPDNVPVNRELARLYLSRNDPRHALQKLQVCFKADQRDVETLELLASAFLALGQRQKTVSVWREIAHLHGEAGRAAEAANVFRKVLSIEPGDPEALAAVGGARAVGTGTDVAQPSPAQKRFMTTGAIDRYATAAIGAEPLVEQPFGAPPRDGAFDAEPRPTGQGTRPDELDELGTLVRDPVPQQARAAEGDSSDIELAVEDLGDEAFTQDEAHGEQLAKILDEVDVYIKYGLAQKAMAHLEHVFRIDARNLEGHERLKDLYVSLDQRKQAGDQLVKLIDLAAAVSHEQAEGYLRELIAFDGDEGRARTLASHHRLRLPQLRAPGEPADDSSAVPLDSDDVLVELSTPHDAMEYSLDDIGESPDEFPLHDETMEVEDDQVAGEMELDESDLSSLSSEDLQSAAEQAAAAMASTEDDRTVDAALDFADLGEMGSREFAVDPGDAALSESMGSVTPPPAEQPREAAPAPQATGLEDDLDEAEFYVSQGLWDDARDLLASLLDRYPGHPLVQAKLRDVEAMATHAAGGDATAPAAPPAAPAASAAAAPPAPPAPSPPASPRPKVIAKTMGDEDADTHYDLGVAYKEMQLFDEAIREFELVRDAAGKTVQCHLMIGLCQAERGRWEDAVAEFKRGLYVERITDREALALYYELGAAYEATGDPREALYYFEKVHKREPRFRDAGKRADKLRAQGARPRDDGDDTIFEGEDAAG